ncbi:MAG: alanine racemase [Syntrophales bacterium]|nr:alanine racemase [Syntrophales bacterium]HPB70837.1 alanine racemase [Syntrophales bacterium]HQN26561.1 alanine racemase [Syntrophales bacterium]HQP29075.1 alanine racemase [Syntrophales bacterium]
MGIDPGDYVHYRDLLKGERLPAAFVDLDRFDANVAYVASTQRATGKRIRVASKSLRCTALIRRIFARGGASYRGILGFTVEEAAFLAERGFDDLLVAYPTVQPSDLSLLSRLTASGKQVSLVVDAPAHLERLSAAGERAGVTLSACLEVDLSYRPFRTSLHLGARRSPIRTPAEALALAHAARSLPGVRIDAVMGYEGHIASTNDDLPGARLKNRVIRLMKRASVPELTQRRAAVVRALRNAGVSLRVVNGGGSGSLVSSGRDPSLTEVTAGSAFYGPALFHHFHDVHFQPAAFFAVQVVRKPADGMVTCLGGGYAASGAAGPDKLPRPVLPPGMRLLPLEGAGEVQTPLTLPADGPELNVGDPVIFQHAKAGELAERFNALLLIRGDRIVERVPTYRGEGVAFL